MNERRTPIGSNSRRTSACHNLTGLHFMFVTLLLLPFLLQVSSTCTPITGLACSGDIISVSQNVSTCSSGQCFVENILQMEIPASLGSCFCFNVDSPEIGPKKYAFCNLGLNTLIPVGDTQYCSNDPHGHIPEEACRCPGGSGTGLSDLSVCDPNQACFRSEFTGNAAGCLFKKLDAHFFAKVQFDMVSQAKVEHLDWSNADHDFTLGIFQYSSEGCHESTIALPPSSFEGFDYQYDPVHDNVTEMDTITIEALTGFPESATRPQSIFTQFGQEYYLMDAEYNEPGQFDIQKACSIKRINNSTGQIHWEEGEVISEWKNSAHGVRCKHPTTIDQRGVMITPSHFADSEHALASVSIDYTWIPGVSLQMPQYSGQPLIFKMKINGTVTQITNRPRPDIQSLKCDPTPEVNAKVNCEVCVRNNGETGDVKIYEYLDTDVILEGSFVVPAGDHACHDFLFDNDLSDEQGNQIEICATTLYPSDHLSYCKNITVEELPDDRSEGDDDTVDQSGNEVDGGLDVNAPFFIDGATGKWHWWWIVLVVLFCVLGAGLIIAGGVIIYRMISKSKSMQTYWKIRNYKKIQSQKKMEKELEELEGQMSDEDADLIKDKPRNKSKRPKSSGDKKFRSNF